MTTYHEKLAPQKSEPHGAMKWTPSETQPGCGLLVLAGKRCTCSYLVVRFPAAGGFGLRFTKTSTGSDATETSYDVFCGPHSEFRCSCKGAASGRTACKHALAADALIVNGWLNLTPPVAPAPVAAPAMDPAEALDLLTVLLFGPKTAAKGPCLRDPQANLNAF